MNKVLVAVGLLSASVAFGQTTRTTNSSSTTSTSNYNNTNTDNTNSRNATTGSNSSTSGSMSTGTTGTGSTGTSGTYNNSTGTYNSGTTGTGTTGSSTGTGSMGTGATGTGSTGTTGTYNSNGTYNNSTTVTPSGSSNYNTMGTSGATTTTPSTSGSYNSNVGTSSTSTSTYSTQTTTARPRDTKDYKNFAYGIYAGLNTTKFKGESFDANGAASGLTGRLGYQLGFFVRGGGRLYGQIGAEYFASSSNYFTTSPGSGTTTANNILDRIDIKYIQVPVYIGYKLTESDRGISSVRVQVGLEYANQIGSTANQFGNLNNFEIKRGTFNGIGQLGFDAGPIFLDLTYHYGFSNAIQQNTGFAGSQRRILSASLGFKF